jgi:anhydro-N-acetylmuramic acid kinase
MPAHRYVAGLMSGTSLDGIDAVLLRISGSGTGTRFTQVAHVRQPYSPGLAGMLLRSSRPGTSRVDEITRLNSVLGVRYALAVRTLARAANIPLSRIALIGSHGQTIHHLPSPRRMFGTRIGATLQIGDPSIIATLTGITTVGNFRPADVAVGGQGAPLVPYVDWLVFRSRSRNRVLLNLGGIGNITVLPRNCAPGNVVAFDTGPGNMAIDGLMRALYNRRMDTGGRIADSGMIIHDLLVWMKKHPYLRRRPPKSTGREEFGDSFVREICRRGRRYEKADLVATATEFTAWTVYDACTRLAKQAGLPDELIVSGGGARNRAILRGLEGYFGERVVQRVEKYGMAWDAKEAVCFGVLANETIHGRCANLPSVTGAKRRVVLGVVCTPQ